MKNTLRSLLRKDRRHWYLVSFDIRYQSAGASVICGCYEKRISLGTIWTAAKSQSIPHTATVVDISYLGCMTRDEFLEGVPDALNKIVEAK